MSGTEEPTMTTRCSVCLTFCPLSPLSKYTTPNPPLPNSPPIEYLVFDMVLKSVSTPVVHSAVTTVVSMTSRIFWMLNCERCQLSVLRQRRPLASIATLTSLVLPSLSLWAKPAYHVTVPELRTTLWPTRALAFLLFLTARSIRAAFCLRWCRSTVCCFYSVVSTQTFWRALTASVDSCAEMRVPLQWRNPK